jgi:hypothetical protein
MQAPAAEEVLAASGSVPEQAALEEAGGAAGGANAAASDVVHILQDGDVHGRAPGLACPAAGCARVFKTSQTLRLHLRSHPPGAVAGAVMPDAPPARRGRFACCAPGCPYGAGGKTLASLKSAVNHYHQAHSEKGLACSHAGCTQRFAKKSALNRHVKNAHSAHSCACGKRLCSKAALRKHVATWAAAAPGVHAEVAEAAEAEPAAQPAPGGAGAIAAFATAGDAATVAAE